MKVKNCYTTVSLTGRYTDRQTDR